MFRRIACIALMFAAPALAQESAPPATPPAPPVEAPAPPVKKYATVLVRLQTTLGPVDVAVETERAPITAGNFLKYVDQKRLDGTTFYRAVKVGTGYGLLQGGLNNDPRKLLPPIAHEPTTRTGLSHVDGAISMARNAPGTAAGDFFIVIGDLVSMDADPKQPGDNAGFAVFGKIANGMDLVRQMLDAPTSPTLGVGAMKGQMLLAPVKILTARRLPPAP